MSNFINSRIICNYTGDIGSTKIDFALIEYAVKNNFGLHILGLGLTKENKIIIDFRISDNFLVEYCEYFLEPILYSPDGNALIESIGKDLDKLRGLAIKILNFDFVERIELRFSYVEVDEYEYELCETTIEDMKECILEKYLTYTDFPVIKVIIER